MNAKGRLKDCIDDVLSSKELRRVDEAWMHTDFYDQLKREGALKNGELYLNDRRIPVYFHASRNLKLIQRGRLFRWRMVGDVTYSETGCFKI